MVYRTKLLQQLYFDEQSKILKASEKIIVFLLAHDKKLMNGKHRAWLQSDMKGQKGDVETSYYAMKNLMRLDFL